jgi:hypothetical protein
MRLRSSLTVRGLDIPALLPLAVVRFLRSFFDVAEFCLARAQVLVDGAFDLLGLIASQLAKFLLNLSTHFLYAPFNLILIDAHGNLLLSNFRQAAESQRWSSGQVLRAPAQGNVSAAIQAL